MRNVNNLLWFFATALFAIWVMGLAGIYHLGSNHQLIHLLLILAIVIVVFNVLDLRRGPPD